MVISLCLWLLTQAYSDQKVPGLHSTVTVLTPYRAQVHMLMHYLIQFVMFSSYDTQLLELQGAK